MGKGYGMRDCSAKCELFGKCQFTRLRAIFGCVAGGICEANGVFSARSFVEKLRTYLNNVPVIARGNYSLGPVNTSLYVLSWEITPCLFSAKQICMDVVFDVLDPNLVVGKTMLKMERAQDMSDEPFFIKFAGQVDTKDRSTTGRLVSWVFISLILFIMLCILCQHPIKR